MSLEPYRLTGVQLTNWELGVDSSVIVIELKYMGIKCAGKKIHENLLKCGVVSTPMQLVSSARSATF